jgi:hypothetical protein
MSCEPRMQPSLRGFLLILAACIAAAFFSCSKEKEVAGEADDLAKRLEKLRSVPYASGTEEKVDPDISGVVLHDSGKAFRGYNLICRQLDLGAYLMDMDGEVVHAWTYPDPRPRFWMRAELLANGDLMTIHKLKSLLRLDWDSDLIWSKRIMAHHDFAFAPDSTIYVHSFGGEMHRGFRVLFGTIVHLNSEGREIGRWSAHDHLDHLKETLDTRSFLDTILDSLDAVETGADTIEAISGQVGTNRSRNKSVVLDYLHPNTLTMLQDTPLGRRDERFKAGNLLVCFRNVNQIAIMDLPSMEIVWSWGEGILEWPHHPTMLDNGNILVYDNGVVREYTRVLEMDPLTGNIVWEYDGAPDNRFYSATKGSAQRLANGNTLICDANNGRAIEVTRGGEIVWEWLNPEMKGEYRAQLYRIVRYPPEMVKPLLSKLGANRGEVAGRPRTDAE